MRRGGRRRPAAVGIGAKTVPRTVGGVLFCRERRATGRLNTKDAVPGWEPRRARPHAQTSDEQKLKHRQASLLQSNLDADEKALRDAIHAKLTYVVGKDTDAATDH